MLYSQCNEKCYVQY